jgi:CheY-like chemotaxis protein
MTARPRVLVAAGSDTFALRLRLMLEAEGADVLMVSELPLGTPPSARLVVTTPSRRNEIRSLDSAAPVVEVDEHEDFDQLRSRLTAALADPGPREARELGEALARARILLVDDSATYREFLRLELSRLGAQVTACPTAEEALEHLRTRRWDCMLVDLVMPGIDGVELCSRVAQLRRDEHRSFVLIVLSSREGKADLIRSLEAGADEFIGKSLDMPLFRAKLGAMLRHRFLVP